MINFFALGETGRLADLPGYGYASVPQALRATWDDLIGGYLMGRRTLVGVVVLMDARRPLTDNDRNFLEWLRPVAASRLILLSKADKLSRAEQAKTLARTRAGARRGSPDFGGHAVLEQERRRASRKRARCWTAGCRIKSPRKRGTKPGAENAPAWGRGNPLREVKRETTCIV